MAVLIVSKWKLEGRCHSIETQKIDARLSQKRGKAMSRRTTKDDITQVERVINGMLERKGYNVRIFVQWAYGRPRAHLYNVCGQMQSDLSPRLPTGEMYRWLCAFDAGLNLGLMDHRFDPPDGRKEI